VTSWSSAIGISTAILATVAAMAIQRHWQMQRAEARLVFQTLEREIPMAQTLLTSPDADGDTSRRGDKLAVALLAKAGLPLDSADVANWELPTWVPSSDERRLRRIVSELLFVMANDRMRGADSDDTDRRPILDSAMRLNTMARQICSSPVPPALALQQAELLKGAEQPEQADRLAEIARSLPARTSSDQFLAVLQSIHEGKWLDAIPALEQAANDNPFSLANRLLLGNAYRAVGRLSDAEFTYGVCVALAPDSRDSRFYRGLARLEARRYSEAIEDFTHLLQKGPARFEVLFNRATAWHALGKNAEAERDLAAAVVIRPDQPRAFFMLARVRRSLGQSDAAEADLRRGFELRPKSVDDWLARGHARLDVDPDGALSDFRQALRLDPRSRSAMRNIAHVLADVKERPDDALRMIDQILELSTQDADDLISRAVLHARQGHAERARADAARALALRRDGKILFQASCVHALLCANHPDDKGPAISLLAEAISQDGRWLNLAMTDPDLSRLRETNEFRLLARSAMAVRRAARMNDDDE
jgi:tetratricopeptide (TPR) repeat protein